MVYLFPHEIGYLWLSFVTLQPVRLQDKINQFIRADLSTFKHEQQKN